jgi:hypothetical protein
MQLSTSTNMSISLLLLVGVLLGHTGCSKNGDLDNNKNTP